MRLDPVGAASSPTYDDFQDVFIDATTLASARDSSWFAKSYIEICENGDESNRSYPNAKRTLQTLLSSVEKILRKSGFDDQRHLQVLSGLAEKRPLKYPSYYDSDILKNAAPYLADRTDPTKGSMYAPFIIGALRVKKIALSQSKKNILDPKSIEDPAIRSAIKVSDAFDTLMRAAIVREEDRTKKALEALELATSESFQVLDQWAFPEKYAPEENELNIPDLSQDLTPFDTKDLTETP